MAFNSKDFNILIVEDCPIQRTKIEVLLKREGFNVVTAENGQIAFDIICKDTNWQPDIILTDIHMPQMDGLSLIIRIHEYNAELRAIVLTASATNEVLADAFEAGAVDFISKPVEKFELLARIKNSLDIIVSERELKEKNLLLEKLSNEDSLTGLLNRRAFFKALSAKIEETKRYNWPLSLLMFDVDDFKDINDKYGHITGDYVLRKIAGILKSKIRKTDFACRYGGDEFIVLFNNTELLTAKNIADKIRAMILNVQYTEQPDLKIMISGGVSQYEHDQTEEEFIVRSDKGLYKAKLAGKNRIELNIK